MNLERYEPIFNTNKLRVDNEKKKFEMAIKEVKDNQAREQNAIKKQEKFN